MSGVISESAPCSCDQLYSARSVGMYQVAGPLPLFSSRPQSHNFRRCLLAASVSVSRLIVRYVELSMAPISRAEIMAFISSSDRLYSSKDRSHRRSSSLRKWWNSSIAMKQFPVLSDCSTGADSPCSAISSRMTRIPLPFVSAKLTSCSTAAIWGLRVSDPGCPSRSSALRL